MEWIPTWGGFWVSLLFGIGGVAFGIWTRWHPPHARLFADVNTEPIGVPRDSKVEVHYDGDPLQAPNLVLLTLRHIGGQEIDEFREGSITFAPGKAQAGAIKGLLGDGAEKATLDSATSTVSIKPLVFKTGRRLVISAIADGNPELVAKVELANVKHVTDATTDKGLKWLEWVTGASLVLGLSALVAVFARTAVTSPNDFTGEYIAVNLVLIAGFIVAGVTVFTTRSFRASVNKNVVRGELGRLH